MKNESRLSHKIFFALGIISAICGIILAIDNLLIGIAGTIVGAFLAYDNWNKLTKA